VIVELGRLSELHRAQIARLRAQMEFVAAAAAIPARHE
jgi:hypothetical protein